MRLSDIVCNASLLGLYLTTEEGDSFPELQGALCSVPSDVMQKAEQIFLSQLDFSKILTVSGLMLSAFILFSDGRNKAFQNFESIEPMVLQNYSLFRSVYLETQAN